MGYHKDLGCDTVNGIDPLTGYPKTAYGHLLDPLDHQTGRKVWGWSKRGTKLYHFTNPYGFLAYAVGSSDDFHCFDFKQIQDLYGKHWVILDATLNSETGSFIDGAGYYVLSIENAEKRREVVRRAWVMVTDAIEWMGWQDIRHDVRGWNQDPFFFARDVARELFADSFDDRISTRMMRRGGKRIDRIMNQIMFPSEL